MERSVEEVTSFDVKVQVILELRHGYFFSLSSHSIESDLSVVLWVFVVV
jgi:hypothetical protein